MLLVVIIVILLVMLALKIINKRNNGEENISNIIEQNVVEQNEAGLENINDLSNRSNDNFELKFLKMENNKKNMIYSPLSVKYALNMLNEGANGKTKTEIENIIKDVSITKYDGIENVLSLANSIFIKDSYKKYIKEDYKNVIMEKYNSEINYDSFKNASNINKWIENKSLGKLKNVVNDELVQNPNTQMFLVNSLAIDMEWIENFEGSKTSGNEFILENGNKINATMMNKETSSENISFYKDESIKSVNMDLQEYNNTQLQFMAIMPNNNLADYINTFTMEDINNIIKKSTLASETENGLKISIPKFSFDYDLSLKNDLKDIGINEAFDENLADFSNMTDNTQGLYVMDALHKANIDFTEKGIEASASTVVVMANKSMSIYTDTMDEIKFDKPFLYLIIDKNTNEVWFVGTVYEPNLWEKDKVDYQ